MSLYYYRPGHPKANDSGMVDARDLDEEIGAARVPLLSDRFMEGARSVDGTDIGSRSKRRNYMKAEGLADASDFSAGYFERQKRAQEVAHDREIRDAVIEAYRMRRRR